MSTKVEVASRRSVTTVTILILKQLLKLLIVNKNKTENIWSTLLIRMDHY